ncbi:MAG: DNA topoisomerase, partial [Bacteroidota bacterium]|nr:DNA topoisomerase [Bacteroidota bacterium]
DDDVKDMLPPLTIGQALTSERIQATQRFSRPAPRYTEASLVKKLEEMGIGRPSTYAPTISTIQKRGYVEKDNREGKERKYQVLTLVKDNISNDTKTELVGAEKAKLFPTDMAMVVNDFLVDYFPSVIDYSFTAKVEEEFDQIAAGKKAWDKMIEHFYSGFHETVTTSQNVERSSISGTRELGVHPETGKKITARLGRFGPFVQMGEENEDTKEKPVYASLRKGQFLESITLEDALDLFKLPRIIGTFEDKDMTAAIGRFGPFVRHDNKFYSLPKTLDPYTVNAEEAIELIQTKRKADAEKCIKTFAENPDVQVLNGRFGPYIAVGKKNVKIPKDKVPAELTLEECLTLAEQAPDKPARGGFKKKAEATADTPAKTTAKKATAKKPAAKKTTGAKKSTATAKKK